MHKGLLNLIVLATAALAAGCTVSRTPTPPLSGPSELGLSLATTATPDVISQDGASQSRIAITAYDSQGQPAKNVPIRAEIIANGSVSDFGTISARSLVTGNDGTAAVTYTAPAAPLVQSTSGNGQLITIMLTPASGDVGNSTARTVDIRLVPPGTISLPGPTASFTASPAAPLAFTNVLFDGAASTATSGALIASYAWNFGDGSQATGNPVTHQFAAGTFSVTLTVTDSNGSKGSASKIITVGAGAGPTALFTFSPSAPKANVTTINFNGGLSKAGVGHTLTKYEWDFGSGVPQSGATVSKMYDTAGTYNVVLTVTDESGQTASVATAVTVVP